MTTTRLTDSQIERLYVESGQVFTPGSPINRRDLFSGRPDEIRRIIDCVNSAGRHAILYGEKGVGKTSLAAILKDLFADHPQIRIVKINCEVNDSFASVWDKALLEVPILKEEGEGSKQYALNQWLNLNEYVGPGQIRKVLQIGNETIPDLVIVFDEFNRLSHEQRKMFPETIKDLADSHTCATLVLVGVANDVSDLLSQHASVSRNISEIKMPLMDRIEIQKIIDNGLAKLGMKITDESMEMILILAQGFPHYAHLLGKEASKSAIIDGRLLITLNDITEAIQEAIKDNSYNVADEYHKATMANRKGTLFEPVLLACALAQVDDLGSFSSTDVRPVLNAITGGEYETYGFSQHLDKFSSDEARGPILLKQGSSRCYRYRFVNPVIRPYAILKGMSNGIVTRDVLNRISDAKKSKKKKAAPRVMPTPKRTSPGKTLYDDLP